MFGNPLEYEFHIYDIPGILLFIFLAYNLYCGNPITIEKQDGKKLNIVITGAAQGIGKHLAQIMALKHQKELNFILIDC